MKRKIRHKVQSFLSTTMGRIVTIILAVAIFLGGGLFAQKQHFFLTPGPVSAYSEGDMLGGYQSHASFEQECGHCHAPIHCVIDTRCQDCHIEIAKQRVSSEGLHGRLPTTSCQSCHVEHQGREVHITEFAFVNVDHEKLAGFSLVHHRTDYNDAPLTCESCHVQDRFEVSTLDCISCHIEADHDYAAAHIEQFGTDCVSCHDGRDRMENFDHNDVYILDGAHESVECENCHVNQMYIGTSSECSSCHQKGMRFEMFGQNCSRCHSTAAWTPAQLTEHNFELEHGEEAINDCQLCHTHTYSEYTCYGCHEHEQANMHDVHAAEEIIEFDDCIECHPTGQPEETENLKQASTQ